MIISSFMGSVFDRTRRAEIIANAGDILSQVSQDGVSLVGTGMSGAMMLATLAHQHDLPCTMVRKPNVESHSTHRVEGEIDFEKYIIVDDVIDSGSTIEHIQESIKNCNPDAKLEGILLYAEMNNTEELEDRFECWVRHI